MFRKREFKALPINWREIYKVDKVSEVPKYAWNNRGTLVDWYDVIPCMFSNQEEAEKFDKEHHKWGLFRNKFADWWMSSEPEIVEIDPETLQEIPFVPTQKWLDAHPEFSNEKLEAGKSYIWITTKNEWNKEERNIFVPL